MAVAPVSSARKLRMIFMGKSYAPEI
jgi:hypothetical protein